MNVEGGKYITCQGRGQIQTSERISDIYNHHKDRVNSRLVTHMMLHCALNSKLLRFCV